MSYARGRRRGVETSGRSPPTPRANRTRRRSTVGRFAAVAGPGVTLNWLIVRAASELLDLHYLFGQVAATAAVLLVGYVLNRRWTFRAGAPHPSAQDR